MHARYDLARVAHALLLEAVPNSNAEELAVAIARLESRIGTWRQGYSSLDFPFWARGTLAEVVAFLADGGLIELTGAGRCDLNSQDEWKRALVRRTAEGDDFIRRARGALPQLFEQVEGKSSFAATAAISA